MFLSEPTRNQRTGSQESSEEVRLRAGDVILYDTSVTRPSLRFDGLAFDHARVAQKVRPKRSANVRMTPAIKMGTHELANCEGGDDEQ
jgi:hypothetical protein